MKIREIIEKIEAFAPLAYQESYDNTGLTVGDAEAEATGALLTLDVSMEALEEAIERKLSLIVSHHPLIFSGLKRLTGATETERIVMRALREGIALYAAHTNLDNAPGGVSFRMGEMLGLRQMRVMIPLAQGLVKIVVYTPSEHGERVREALISAGGGHIGNYSGCTFSTPGTGTFRPEAGSHPFIGSEGALSRVAEERIETVIPRHRVSRVLEAVRAVHPYEEMAYDLFPLEQPDPTAGTGVIGQLPEPEETMAFLSRVADTFGVKALRYSKPCRKQIGTVALCGGSGASFAKEAIRQGADIYLSGDFKYHDFAGADNRIVLADIGHFESELCTINIFYDIIRENFPNFAIYKRNANCNPVNYL